MDALKIYKNLYKHFGPQGWWPTQNAKISSRGGSALGGKMQNEKLRKSRFLYDWRFEVCLGAILTQNTAWTNVEKALQNLICAELLTPEAIVKYSTARLAKLIRSTGYFCQKAKKLKIFSTLILKKYNGNINSLFSGRLEAARWELLSVWGIGPETADSMLLYAGHKPTFVIDAYTKRLCEHCGVKFDTYDEYKNFFENKLPRSSKLYNEYHALVVAWGKLYRNNRQIATEILKY